MILPADSYIVVNKGNILEIDKKILIDLYQPIIGSKAISLYLTLLNDLEKKYITETFTHHHLLSVLQMSLNDIKISREKLEGVGLLKTYLKKDNINNYVYVLYNPISANEFLNHPILNIVLYNNVGKKEYERIVENYKIPRISLKDYEDITLSFNEVFTSVSSNSFITNEDLTMKNKNKLSFSNFFDMDLLISGINEKLNVEKVFNEEVKDLILNLSFIYKLDVATMQNLIRASLNEKGMIDKESLRKSARNYYRFEHSGNLPSIIYSKQPDYLKTPQGDNSKKAMMIYTFENAHPYQLLKSKYKDGKVVDFDAKEGYEALKSLLDLDEGSSRLGEVALISYDSPISNLNILFNNTLFDENASCHLALGNAYAMNVVNGTTMKEEELVKLGYNVSLTHVDFMFGSSDMKITGYTHDGKEIPIFVKGNFVF